MKASVQVITTPTADTPGTTLLLNFERKRYLIGNIAEGTQRAAIQRKAKLAAVKDIFLTGEVKWANVGGIMGMILTVADIISGAKEAVLQQLTEKFKKRGQQVPPELLQDEGNSWLNLHGGRNLTHVLATARRFIFRKGVPLHTNEFTVKTDILRKEGDWEPTWKDDFVQVWSMVIEPEEKDELRAAYQRKRSHDEFMENAQTGITGKVETREEQEDRYEQLKKSVISDMFDSNWRLDALIKKRLGEVQLPAEVFHRDEEGKIGKYTGPMPAEDPSVSNIEVLVRNPWPGAMVECLPPTTPSETSICYFFKSHPQRGKFDPKLAEKLGVPNGPLRAKIVRGEAITTEDGKVVTPDMVMGATRVGGGFAVIELPSEAYIEPLLARKEWEAEEVMSGVGAIFWILGPNVLHDERLQKFMTEKKELKHIVSSKDCCPDYLAMESAATLATKLNMIDAERFPIPKFDNELLTDQAKDLPFEAAMIGLNLEIQPEIKLRKDLASKFLSIENVKTETHKIYPDALAIASSIQKQITAPEYLAELKKNQEDILHKDAEVITLGTGSALPSKYRNVSATLLRVPGVGSYLFDAGENTIGQLRRVFGDELPEVLKDLKAIWISHLHADHHLGTTSVIKAWHEQTKDDASLKDNQLVVASDIAMLNWLQEYSQIENYGYSRIEPVSMTKPKNENHIHSFASNHSSGLASITSCPVRHCNGALAVVFELPDSFKVAYSGDCRPNREFARIGHGATLLIHEATFDDELQGDAYAKKHCTTSEALDIGRQMDARRILLTHFSQRYQKIKETDPQGGKGQVAVVAFDYMRVRIGDMVKVEGFKQAMAKLFDGREKNGDD